MNQLYKPVIYYFAAIVAVAATFRLIHDLLAPVGWLVVVVLLLAIVGRIIWYYTSL